jgi:hypothetical protein
MSALGFKAIITGFFIFTFFSAPLLEANPRTSASMRSFDEIFPGLAREQRQMVFSETGIKNTFTRNEGPLVIPALNSGVDLLGAVMEKRPTQLVESLLVVPYTGRALNKLDIYNAIGRIQNISDYMIYVSSRGGHIPLFEESTRLQNGNRNRPIPDPPPATILPSSETVYLCIRDTFFGNTYFRGDLTVVDHGITYYLTNNTAVWFLLFPLMRAEKFASVLYVEPLVEGTLVYGMAGIDIPEFIATRINLSLQIDRRLTVLIDWLSDGLRSIY